MNEMLNILTRSLKTVIRKDCGENCLLLSQGLDPVLVQKISNHPVHIIEEDGSISPSSLIPFCWFGEKTNLGVKIDQFKVPVCSGFKRKLRNNQLCFEFDPEDNIRGNEVRNGLFLIVDDNMDKMMNIDSSEVEAKKPTKRELKYHRDNANAGIKVYLDAIGIHIL